MNKESVTEYIRTAFGDTVYPGDENIVPKTQYDNEVQECEAKFKGKKWQEVDWHAISNEGWASGCAFLTDEAYRYYLPAYMISILEQPEGMANAINPVVASLTMPDVSDYERTKETLKDHASSLGFLDEQIKNIGGNIKYFNSRIGGFSSEQGIAIRMFLECLNELCPDDFFNKEPIVAIERYWNKFS